MVYSCSINGMMSGQYGLTTRILFWSFSLLITGLIISAIYYLIKTANKK
jgi:hypothetical protein